MYQRNLSVPPRIARQGFGHAGPAKRTTKRAMLIPKTGDPIEHIPRLMDFSEVLCPPERRALREIVETADIVHEGKYTYLVTRVSSDTLDALGTFETGREDLEEGGDHEPSIGNDIGYILNDRELDTSDDEPDCDDEPDHDNEPDYLNAPHVFNQEAPS